MCVLIVLDYFFTRYEIGAEGLKYRTLFRRSGIAKWSDVEEVRFTEVMGCFRIRLRRGKTLRISVMLVGLPELAQALLRSVPSEIIDEETIQVLEQTAHGDLPSIE